MKFKVYERQYVDIERIVCFTIEAESQADAERLYKENYPYEIAENFEETVLDEDCYECQLEKIERAEND